MENEVKSKKTNKGLIVIIIILILLVLGLVGYICYDKGLIFKSKSVVQEEERTTEKEEISTTRDLTEEEKKEFEDIITRINPYFSQYYPVNNLSAMVDNQELLLFVTRQLGFSRESFTASEVEEIVKKYFGNTLKVNHENILCSIDKEPYYIYDSSTSTYTKAPMDLYSHGHDGLGYMSVIYSFVSGKVKDEKTVEINSHLLYEGYRGSTWGPTTAYYSNYSDCKNYTNPVYEAENKDEDIEFTDQLYQSIKDKFPITTYTFEKNSEGYYDLISVMVK